MRINGSTDAFAMSFPQKTVEHNESIQKSQRTGVEKILKEGAKAMQVQDAKRELSEEDIFRQVGDANEQLKVYDRRLEFSIHDETHRIMVKVINTIDDSVIREIPSEKALDMLAYVWKMTGILVDEKR